MRQHTQSEITSALRIWRTPRLAMRDEAVRAVLFAVAILLILITK